MSVLDMWLDGLEKLPWVYGAKQVKRLVRIVRPALAVSAAMTIHEVMAATVELRRAVHQVDKELEKDP